MLLRIVAADVMVGVIEHGVGVIFDDTGSILSQYGRNHPDPLGIVGSCPVKGGHWNQDAVITEVCDADHGIGPGISGNLEGEDAVGVGDIGDIAARQVD